LNNENKDVNPWRNNAKLWPDLPKSPRRMIVDSPFFTLVEERAYIRGDHRDASFESRGRRLGQATDSERTAWLARSAGMEVVRGDVTAIPFVMATERIAEFEGLVGRWDEARHRAALADGRHAYFVARDGSEPIGFVILRDWASPERVTLVKRIAVSRPGCGYGRALLAKVIDAVFEETVTWRLWLGVYPDNLRARRAYEALGFQAEGIARGSAFFGGVSRDELVMALLRPEWAAGRQV
jgi:RimJ/RimL family protein N-acetyltransferase